MLIVLLVLGIGLFAIGAWLFNNTNHDLTGEITAALSIILLLAVLVIGVVSALDLGEFMVIDQKIAMYQTENEKIQSELSDTIEAYKAYEGETLKSFKSENPLVLINLYPELKTDTLVAKQVEIYVANNDKIKQLKEQKLDAQVAKWWLYFGGGEQIIFE